MERYLPYLFTLFLFIGSAAYGQQEEDERCVEPDKKVMKLLKEAENTKNARPERLKYYTQAIELAPENASVYYAFAVFNYRNAENVQSAFDQGQTNFSKLKVAYDAAANTYKRVIENCPDFHSDAYYKLGYIYYLLNDKGQSAQYFKGFLDFDARDPNKYSQTYSKDKADVLEILPEMEFFDKFYANPVPYSPKEVKNVSSDKDEFLPMISPDNELIFFTRRGISDNPTGIINPVIEAFTVSQRANINALFNNGIALTRPFNTSEYKNYGGVSLSLDNKEMFICACEEVPQPQGLNCDIYRTTFERSGEGGNDFTWTKLENLGPAINTPDGWEAQPSLSADGKTLYFASWREGSQLTDIYYSNRKADGTWSQAKPVPGPVNSAGHDKAPFLHQDSETMYFVSECSNQRKGAGGSDMFYTRKDENGNWMEPTNMGHPINTEGNEVGMVVSTDGHLAYFTSSNATSKGYDIFYFELYAEARPQKVKFFKGVVKDEAGDPIKDAVVEISYKDSKENVEIKVNGDDGKFAAIINVKEGKEEDVMITLKKEGNSFATKLIKKEELIAEEVFSEEVLAMEIGEIKVGKAFTIDEILFATDSYVLNADSKFILDQFVKFLHSNPSIKVTIQGHTDDIGDASANKVLSANRAKATMNYIVSSGISDSRLKSEGFGASKPKVKNSSETNRAKNRRTDFLITAY